jgi:hypothetical protein
MLLGIYLSWIIPLFIKAITKLIEYIKFRLDTYIQKRDLIKLQKEINKINHIINSSNFSNSQKITPKMDSYVSTSYAPFNDNTFDDNLFKMISNDETYDYLFGYDIRGKPDNPRI